ncbi:MAG: hypothetical protein QM572_04765 [Nocardioides sp.]|uniref:hypothetical protein n=1 Tax=Nocardioides sp. TaxID=35761 RepID=UPI0039E56666
MESRLRASTLLAMLALVALIPLAAGCSRFGAGDNTSPKPTETVTGHGNTETGQSVSGGNIFEELDVSTDAPDCGTVWVVGQILPNDYDWCWDSTTGVRQPRAGVRSGPCEVVTFRNVLFAIPGFAIQQSATVNEVDGVSLIGGDPTYKKLLTSCLRTPCPDAPEDSNKMRIPYPQCDRTKTSG